MEQGSKEWLEWRKSRIGASDAPIIMGDSPWKTPYQLWEEKLGIREQEAPNERMRRGTEMEAEARDAFIRYFGRNLYPMVMTSGWPEWMIASLDAVSSDGMVVEIKCPSKAVHEMARNGVIPDYYKAQLQHQMFVADVSKMYYWSYDGQEGISISVERDDEYIKKLIEKEKEFYECMITGIPPELSDRDYLTREDPEWLDKTAQYISLSSQIEELTLQEKELKESLISLSGGSNVKGGGISISKTVRKGNVDYSKIPELKGVNLEGYRKKPTEFWSVRKIKGD